MMRLLVLVFILAAGTQVASGQKYYTKTGKISFYSKAPLEAIEAHNSKAVSAFDLKTGQIEFSVLMKGFEFAKARMQEDFNENFVESNKYPKAVFTGTIKNPADLKLDTDGVYTTQVTGSLTIHGVTKPQTAPATFTVKKGQISATSEFTVLVADYQIKIPAVVGNKIGKNVTIIVNVPSYQPLGSRTAP